MSAPPARGYLSISEVLAQLVADFPDVTISKIRFLANEGLIEPARRRPGTAGSTPPTWTGCASS